MSSLQVELLEKMGVCFVLLFTKLNKAAAHFSLILWIRLWTPGGNGCQLQCVTQGRMNLHVPSGLANLAWRAESFSQHLVQWCGLVRFSSAATRFIHCALFPAAQILLLMQLAGALFFFYKGMHCGKCWHQGHLQRMFEERVKWDETLASSRECMPHCWPWCEHKRQCLPGTSLPQWDAGRYSQASLTLWDLGTKMV